MIIAKQRLYLTADRLHAVPEGHQDAATLYATVGDIIPPSAAELYGIQPSGELTVLTTPNAERVPLAEVPGIGEATAKALAAVGISDARRLAELIPADVPQLAGYNGMVTWPAWIDAARGHLGLELLTAEPAPLAAAVLERAPGETKERVPGETKERESREDKAGQAAPAGAESATGAVTDAPPAPPVVTLDEIDGIGPATLKALAAAGITEVRQLAELSPIDAPVLEGYGGAPAWPAWIAAAQKLLPGAAVPASGPLPQGPTGPGHLQTLGGAPAAPAIAAGAAEVKA